MEYYGITNKGSHFIEIVESLPEWTAEDENRIVYCGGKIYVGTSTAWFETRGQSGYSGVAGLNGTLVSSGYSGYSGYSAFSGYSGYSGQDSDYEFTQSFAASGSPYYAGYTELSSGLIMNWGYYPASPELDILTMYTAYLPKTFTTCCYYASAILVMYNNENTIRNTDAWMVALDNTIGSNNLDRICFAIEMEALSASDLNDYGMGFLWFALGK